MRVKSPCLLRDRRLTLKPRIIKIAGSGFIVERIVPTAHPSARGFPECKIADTLDQAFAIAHTWVGPKPQETSWPR